MLYKLRSQAEQQLLNGMSFSYFAPLLTQVVRTKGIGLPPNSVEEGLEQVALVVDIMVFSGSEGKPLIP